MDLTNDKKNGHSILDQMSFKTEKSTNSRQSFNSKSEENYRKNQNHDLNDNESIDSKRSENMQSQILVQNYINEVRVFLWIFISFII